MEQSMERLAHVKNPKTSQGLRLPSWLFLVAWLLVMGAALPGRSDTVVQTADEVVRRGGISPDGKTLASCSGDNAVRLWNMDSGKGLHTLPAQDPDSQASVKVATFSPDGKTLATAWSLLSKNHGIFLWDMASGKKQRTLTDCSQPVNDVAFSPDGKLLAAGTGNGSHSLTSDDNAIRLFDVASGKVVHVLNPGSSDRVWSVAFSPDGKLLACGTDGSGGIQLWDVARNKKIKTIRPDYPSESQLAFSPDGKLLASGSKGMVDIWNVASGKKVHRIDEENHDINSVTFSPNGKILAIAGGDATLELCDVGTGKLLRALTGHQYQAYSATFSRDGKTLASSATGDKCILKVWDVNTGKCMRTIGARTRTKSKKR